MKHLIFICLLFSSYASTFASESAYEEANIAYKEGNFQQAIELYQTILQSGTSSEVLYNLGNAYYKTGQFPEAILYFEKAFKQNPNDSDVKHNLGIAKLQLKDKIDPKPEFFLLTWWKQLAQKQKANQWTIFFFVFLWLSILLFLIFALNNLPFKKTLFFSGCGSLIFAFILLLLSITQNNFETCNTEAIIMSSSVSVKSAPINTGTDLFIIHSGLKVSILKSEGDWCNIRLQDGKEGWVSIKALSTI